MLYELTKVLPHVYRLHFEDPYQLAMHFLRAQEFYESPKYADKTFTLVEFMEWYSKEYGDGAFTYPKDWGGFNVPSWVLEKVFGIRDMIPDRNKYDENMSRLVTRLTYAEGSSHAHGGKLVPWYLIGTSEAGHQGDRDVEGILEHEIAHALYYTDSDYRWEADALLRQIGALHDVPGKSSSRYELAARALRKAGYHERTVKDEVHAYAATGANIFGLEKYLTPDICRLFEENLRKHKQRLLGKGGRVV